MIQIEKLYKSFGIKSVLENVSFAIQAGDKIGLVGPNGTGKTTLFKIILGQEEQDRGNVTRVHETIGYLPQTISFEKHDTLFSYLKKNLEEDWEEYKIEMVLSEVELYEKPESLISQLSGGQKTKVGIARLLLQDPTLLLLDEPTNNLDAKTMNWFEQFVQKFKGSILVISHDRTFLDNTMNRIFELDPFSHDIKAYSGGYSDYVEEKLHRFEQQKETYDQFEEKKEEMSDWIAKKQVQLSVYRNPKVARQLQAMKTRYEREFVKNAIPKPQQYSTIKISDFGDESYKKKVVFYIENLKFKELFSCNKLTILGGDRIHLFGENGSGKTTFAKILLHQITDYIGSVIKGNDIKVGYFSQEQEVLDTKKTVIDNFMQKTALDNEPTVRKILGKFLFRGVDVYKKTSELSQGEKVRLIIAILAYQKNQFLILDEPTNHLDIQSREILEAALNEYLGGFLIISHDRFFLQQLTINKKIIIHKQIIEAK